MDINHIKPQNKMTLAHSEPHKIVSNGQVQTTEISNLKSGQYIRGVVVDLRYDEAKILLENSQETITAKLDGSFSLSIGQSATFIVNEASNDLISLKIVPNMIKPELDATIEKALQEAGLSLTNLNKEIVQQLINNRMPIGKQVLQYLIRQTQYHKDTLPQTLVQMYQYNIPITNENIAQFEAMQKGSNHLINDLSNSLKSILDALQSPDNPLAMTDNTSYPMINGNNNLIESAIDSKEDVNNAIDKSIIDKTIALLDLLLTDANETITPAVNQTNNQIAVQNSSQTTNQTADQTANQIINHISSSIDNRIDKQSTDQPPNQITSQSAITADYPIIAYQFVLDDNELQDAQILLNNISNNNNVGEGLSNGGLDNANITARDILNIIHNNIQQWDNSTINYVLNSSIYRTIIEKAFENRWSIAPKQLEKGFSIDEFYKRIQRDIEELEKLVQDNKTTTTSAKETITESPIKKVTDQLNFMKSLKDTFIYLQLPVKFKEQTIHSELYVFKRKNNINNKKGPVSALLHMHMPYLGTIDIHVSLNNNNINTVFYTSGNEVGTMVEQNLPRLKDALQKKGFQVQATVKSSNNKYNFEKDLWDQELPNATISRYTFDIRT